MSGSETNRRTAVDFDPAVNLSEQIEVIKNAIIVPFGHGENYRMARPAGIFYPDGKVCDIGQCFRSSNRPTTVTPDFPDTASIQNKISGTTFFGGMAYGHFGHSLCESTSRLWGLDFVKEKIDNIVFFPKKNIRPRKVIAHLSPILRMFGTLPDQIAVSQPTQVEKLVIAPQGFGVGDMIPGSPEFRNFARSRLGENIAADSSKHIYISRSQLFRKRGKLLLEDRIERALEEEGYEIFHPQQHDIDVQIAKYKGAQSIISTDNSALHLAAFVVPENCKICIIKRRPGDIVDDFVSQLKSFANISPTIVEAVQTYWAQDKNRVQMNEVMTLVDFKKLGEILLKNNFVSEWSLDQPAQADIENAVRDLETILENPLFLV